MRDRWDLAPAVARARGHAGNQRLHERWVGFNERKKRTVIANVAVARELARLVLVAGDADRRPAADARPARRTGMSAAATVAVVYECGECGERMLVRRCADCQLFTRRLGQGGWCPHCDEPVLLAELTEDVG